MKDLMQKTVRLGTATLAVATMILAGGIFSHALACNYYASPTGGGNGLSSSSPFKISNFWSVAGPGKTLCLSNGVYVGSDSMIDPPDNLQGSSGSPITVRALNDGGVRINAQDTYDPISLRNGNNWFVIEGVDANNSSGPVVRLDNGASNNIIRRVIAWQGGNQNGGVYTTSGNGSNNLFEDCAGFGRRRGIFHATQGAPNVTFRRCWGMFERQDSPSTGPEAVFEAMYNGNNHRFENVIGTWNQIQSLNPYGLFFIGDEGIGHEILGSIFYVKSGDAVSADQLIYHNANSGITIKDVVAYTEQSSKRPFELGNPSGGTKILQNTTEIGGTTLSSIGSSWTVSNRVAVSSVALAPSIWNGSGTNGARVCKQYINGALTSNPLWPWPMDARIRAALSTAGKNPDAIFGGTGNSVTQLMEQKFGPIPSECRRGSQLAAPTNLTITVP
jgi:hypothetical protein